MASSRDAKRSFYYHYGMAFANWAALERELFDLFRGFFNGPEKDARTFFYGTRGFSDKVKYLKMLLPSNVANKTEKKYWEELFEVATKASKWRNHLAHGHIFGRRRGQIKQLVSMRRTSSAALDFGIESGFRRADVIRWRDHFESLALLAATGVEFRAFHDEPADEVLGESITELAQLHRQIQQEQSREERDQRR